MGACFDLSCSFDSLKDQFWGKAARTRLDLHDIGWEGQLQRPGRFFGWSLVAYALITVFGETTGPLLILLAADGVVGLLIIRCCMEMQAAMVALPARRTPSAKAAPQRELDDGGL